MPDREAALAWRINLIGQGASSLGVLPRRETKQ